MPGGFTDAGDGPQYMYVERLQVTPVFTLRPRQGTKRPELAGIRSRRRYACSIDVQQQPY